jgi:hypothetical protein
VRVGCTWHSLWTNNLSFRFTSDAEGRLRQRMLAKLFNSRHGLPVRLVLVAHFTSDRAPKRREGASAVKGRCIEPSKTPIPLQNPFPECWNALPLCDKAFRLPYRAL